MKPPLRSLTAGLAASVILASAVTAGALPLDGTAGAPTLANPRDPASGWAKEPSNPVVVNHPAGPERSFVGDPGVVYHDGIFYLYYPSAWQLRPEAIPEGTSPDEVALPIEVATSRDGVHFQPFDNGTPAPNDDYVLLRDSKTSWDSGSLETPTVLFDESDGKFKMWYSASKQLSDESERFRTFKIGYAESADGVHWTKYNDPRTTDDERARSDPVLGPRTDRGELFVADPSVIKDGRVYKMWFSVATPKAVTIAYAESGDGVHWRRRDKPVMRASRGEGYVNGPAVLKTHNRYEMWYYAGNQPGVFTAVSQDGVQWTKRGRAIPLGPDGSWDHLEASSPTVAVAHGAYYLYYTGSDCPLEARGQPHTANCLPHISIGLATRPATPAS